MNIIIRKLVTYCVYVHAVLLTKRENGNDALLPEYATYLERKRHRLQGLRIRLRRRLKRRLTALICPPTEPGSLGDQAMIQALTDALKDKGFAVDLLINEPGEDWSGVHGLRKKVLLPRFSVAETYKDVFRQYNSFYVVGADVLDGYYDIRLSQWLIWLAWYASLSCPKVTITGFSLNESPKPESLEMFRILPKKVKICCRDPKSYKRFVHHVGRKPTLAADLAFLLTPTSNFANVQTCMEWVGQRQTNGRVVMGINISAHSFRETRLTTIKEITDLYSRKLNELLLQNKEVDLILLPHDKKGPLSDIKVLEDLYKKLDKNRTFMAPGSLLASEMKLLVSLLDCVLSGRMHLAIACFGSFTPVACVTYQGKFEGLYSFYPGLEKYTESPHRIVESDKALIEFVNTLINDRSRLKNIIKGSQLQVSKLARRNVR